MLQTLKAALRKKGMTYRQLGEHLNLSEAAVKKQFQSADISFNRIIEICEVLNISFNAMVEAARSNPIRELKLTETQQDYFLKNPESFLFFLKLSEAKGNSEIANADLKWERDRLWKALKALDKIELIRLHHSDRVELIYGSLLTISTQNTPMEAITYKLGNKFLEKLQQSKGAPIREIKISLLKLGAENAESLQKDLIRLYQTYLRQSEIDSAFLSADDLKICSLMIAAGEFSFI
jgi:transcriptional regulator with XRE-family HTH domain